MFTGIVDAVGTVVSVARADAGVEIRIAAPYSDLNDGDSIAVNGACLTVRDHSTGEFTVAAVVTTLDRTTIGDWRKGSRVNLERPLRADGRFGGHLVQGHVDGVGIVGGLARRDDAVVVDIDVSDDLQRDIVPLGSVAVDGVSLTVNETVGGKLQVSLIDYTLQHTALDELRPGRRVHIETDVIGKYIRRLVEPYLNSTLAVRRGQDE
jgi:riboflavin synthase